MAHHWELISKTTYIYTPLRTICFILNLDLFLSSLTFNMANFISTESRLRLKQGGRV